MIYGEWCFFILFLPIFHQFFEGQKIHKIGNIDRVINTIYQMSTRLIPSLQAFILNIIDYQTGTMKEFNQCSNFNDLFIYFLSLEIFHKHLTYYYCWVSVIAYIRLFLVFCLHFQRCIDMVLRYFLLISWQDHLYFLSQLICCLTIQVAIFYKPVDISQWSS